VHGIVRKHGGHIAIQNATGQGTEVIILLPCIAAAPEDGKVVPESPPTGSESILIVDDEPSLLIVVEKMLQRKGYIVQAFQHPAEALERFAADPDAFDLILTDMDMPGINGVRLCAEIKALHADIPVIVCTGHSSLVNADNAAGAGFSGYISKPILAGDLARMVRQVLDEETPGAAPVPVNGRSAS